jgi:hypothetical protein
MEPEGCCALWLSMEWKWLKEGGKKGHVFKDEEKHWLLTTLMRVIHSIHNSIHQLRVFVAAPVWVQKVSKGWWIDWINALALPSIIGFKHPEGVAACFGFDPFLSLRPELRLYA